MNYVELDGILNDLEKDGATFEVNQFSEKGFFHIDKFYDGKSILIATIEPSSRAFFNRVNDLNPKQIKVICEFSDTTDEGRQPKFTGLVLNKQETEIIAKNDFRRKMIGEDYYALNMLIHRARVALRGDKNGKD